ncbi:MAG: GSCFA domain-containing protein [Bacteroidota bacterium]
MFRTPVEITPPIHHIALHQPLLLVGSCFTEAMGERFQRNKFEVRVNPFGTLYNPVSLFRLLDDAVCQTMPADDTYLVNQDIHFNYQFHSDFSGDSRVGLQTQIEQTLSNTRQYLKDCQWLILTLGSAFAYERLDNGQLVSNCHKMPAQLFRKRLFNTEEIITQFDRLEQILQAWNPEIQYIFTVSPVRHLRDTLIQNSLSKSVLRWVVHTLQQKYPDNIYYFPSYEIMMDELRDYRFYRDDMLHPSEMAEDYIWQTFVENCLDAKSQNFLKTWKPLYQALQHRAFRPTSEAHQQFLRKTISRLKQLSQQIDVTAEIQELERQII